MTVPKAQRSGWVKYGILLIVAVCGIAGGYYLSVGPQNQRAKAETNGEPSTRPASFTQHFRLTTLDAKDTVEAPDLTADAEGRVFLTWGSKTGDNERTVFVAQSFNEGKTFDAPRALSRGGVFRSRNKDGKAGYERRTSPHVVATGNDLFMTWSEAPAEGSRLRLMLASSADAGATFGIPSPIRAQGIAEANPTFTALAIGPQAELACAWLGGSAGQQPFVAIRRAGAADFERAQLVYLGEGGKGVCPCCPLAAVFAPDGTLYVAFRNIADGYRDIAVCVLRPNQAKFEGPFPVMPPTWKFNGCPHDGPSLAVVGDQLHVVWMDARTGSQRCYHAWAKRADMKFNAAALHPIAAGSQGNAKLHLDPAGRLHAVWEESIAPPLEENSGNHSHVSARAMLNAGGGRAIQHATLGLDALFGSPQAVAPRSGAFQTRPAIAVTPQGRRIIAWNELDEAGKAVVIHSLPPNEHNASGGRP